MKVGIIVAGICLLLTSCATNYKLISKVKFKDELSSISSIKVIGSRPDIYLSRLIGSNLDSSKNSMCVKNSIAKIERKFGEYNIAATFDTAHYSDTLRDEVIQFLRSCYHAKDIKTISVGDRLKELINKHDDRYFMLFYQDGYNRTKPNYYFNNIPFYLLDVLFLHLYYWRWTEGGSRMYTGIVDKQKYNAIYFGYSRRPCVPEEDITANKHFEELIESFVKKREQN